MGYSMRTNWGRDVQCSFCNKKIGDRDHYYSMRNYHTSEWVKRCEECYKKVATTGGRRPKKPDPDFGELMKYRKAALLTYRMITGEGKARKNALIEKFLDNPHKVVMEQERSRYSYGYYNRTPKDYKNVARFYKPYIKRMSCAMVMRMIADHRNATKGKLAERAERKKDKFKGTKRIFPLANETYTHFLKKLVQKKLGVDQFIDRYDNNTSKDPLKGSYEVEDIGIHISLKSLEKGLKLSVKTSRW